MLKPGGDILVTIAIHSPFFDFWENLAKIEKWAPYLKNVTNHISPYQKMHNPAQELRKSLEVIGFVVHVCEKQDNFYTFPSLSHLLGTRVKQAIFNCNIWTFQRFQKQSILLGNLSHRTNATTISKTMKKKSKITRRWFLKLQLRQKEKFVFRTRSSMFVL